MNSANDPTGTPTTSPETAGTVDSISIQPVPPTPTTTTVQEPEPAKPKLSPERFAARLHRLDWTAGVLVLIFAFFLGSFVARNSDLWQHLASGRLIAHGQYHFGQDPFAYSIPDGPAVWTNPNWLYDVAVYYLAGARDGMPASSGIPLVLFKALLTVALAFVLLRIRRPGASLWLPLTVTALALYVLSPRLLLQPTVVSFLLLGVTLYLLQRPGTDQSGQGTFRARWLLPLVCLLWANLDGWFLLGPLTIGLYLLGETGQALLPANENETEKAHTGSLSALSLIFVLSMVACLLNPNFLAHPRLDATAFLPVDVLAVLSDSPLQQQGAFRTLFLGPLQPDYYRYYFAGTLLETPVALAYFVLLGLGVMSFAVNFRDWQWWRAFVWLPLALLSLAIGRAIPFFAIVAAPITVLNFQDFAARYLGAEIRVSGPRVIWAVTGRVLTVVAGVALLIAAWPGWLHPGFNNIVQTRHVGWTVAPNESLRRSAERLHELYARGILHADKEDQPGTRGFNTSPDIANYNAWFCPEEKGFLDFRLPLYPETTAAAYVEVRQIFLPDRTKEDNKPVANDDWKEVLRGAHVNHVIIHSNDRIGLLTTVRRLWFQPQQWVMLYGDGLTAIFGWKEAADRSAAFPGHYFDVAAEAFGPNAMRIVHDAPAPPVPQESWVEHAYAFLRDYWEGPPSRPLELDQINLYYNYFNGMQAMTQTYHRVAALWAGMASPSMMAGPGLPWHALNYSLLGGGGLNAYLADILAPRKNFGPPGAPLVAIRLAREAVAADPRSADAYIELAMAYNWQLKVGEHPWLAPTDDNPVILLRRVQIVNALQNALALDPQRSDAHAMLANVFADLHYYDLADDELTHNLDYERDRDLLPNETEDDRDRRLDQMEQQQEALKKQWHFKENSDLYYNTVAGHNPPPVQKAQLAMQAGLAKEALQVLQDADADQLGPMGNVFRFKLLLSTGRLGDAKDALEAVGKDGTQVALYLATLGDYKNADHILDEFLGVGEVGITKQVMGLSENLAFAGGLTPGNLVQTGQVGSFVRGHLNWVVLRGVVALENGDTATATRCFRQAVQVSLPPMDAATEAGLLNGRIPLDQTAWLGKDGPEGGWEGIDFESRPLAYHYLELLRQAGNKE